jgi:hypothetical protein
MEVRREQVESENNDCCSQAGGVLAASEASISNNDSTHNDNALSATADLEQRPQNRGENAFH